MASLLSSTTSKRAGNYIGETKKQLRDGFGVYNYSNRFFRYEGEWSKGKKHGHGKLLMMDGSFYEGQFQDGEIQGHGFRRWASSGNEFTGQFVRGELNGHGVMVYGDGSRYEGEWMQNQREGEGKLTEADGSVFEGSFHKHKRHGEGKQLYSNGDRYEGDWVNGQRQGHGVIKFHDGTIYAGQWWGDVFNGEGSIIHSSGVTYEGIWVNGRPTVEATQLRIVGETNIEVVQGRPFGFEVECLSTDGDLVQEEGRLLQVTGGVKVSGNRKSPEVDEERITTPFGYDIEPYPVTEMLGDISSEFPMTGVLTQPPSVMSTRPLVSPTGESVVELSKQTENIQITEVGSDGAEKDIAGSQVDSQPEGPNRTCAPSQASHVTGLIAGTEKAVSVMGDGDQTMPLPAPLPPPVAPVRSLAGKVLFENVFIPPLPPGMKSVTSFNSLHASIPDFQSDARNNASRWKKASSVAPNMLKVNNSGSVTSSQEVKRKKDGMADVVEKEGKRRKDKRDEKVDEKFCKPGDYVLIIHDVTDPPFLDTVLEPAFLHVKVNQKKRARSKMESRRN